MEQTWDNLVRQHAEGVVNAALRVLGNSADDEDVAQDVFVEAFQRWPATADHRWSGLLRRMAVCRALDQLRRHRRHEMLSDVLSDPSKAESFDAAIAGELEARLRSALLTLAPREAEVFCLHYYERLDQGENAETLGIAPAQSRPPLLIRIESDGQPVLSIGGHERTVADYVDRFPLQAHIVETVLAAVASHADTETKLNLRDTLVRSTKSRRATHGIPSKYKIKELHAEGGLGRVWLAYDHTAIPSLLHHFQSKSSFNSGSSSLMAFEYLASH